MRILFLTRSFAYLRNFESVVRALAARGHRIHVAADRTDTLGGRGLVDALEAQCPGVTVGMTPERRTDRWAGPGDTIRFGLDYLRFLHPMYDESPHLRHRARERASGLLVGLGGWPGTGGLLRLGLRAMERALPPNPAIDDYLREQAPDVVLMTPLVDLGSPQLEYLDAALARGLRTALGVGSWDHLSSKALLRTPPMRVLLWNETQKREAIELHGVPPERIAVTGAQCYDHWFSWTPARDREAWCRRVGLDPARPYILWLGSALFRNTVPETPYFPRWLRHLRASPDPRLRGASVLIRPHPARGEEWEGLDLSEFGDVAIWPRGGANPVDTRSRSDYYDSIHHSAAVVGLNTSALIESSILGRTVHTILVPEFYDSQQGTLHYRYLMNVAGGVLRVSRSLDEHAEHLSRTLAGSGEAKDRNRAFLEAFVRPFGLDQPATPRFVEAIEALGAAEAPPPSRPPWWARPVRLAMLPMTVGRRRRGDSPGLFGRLLARIRGNRDVTPERTKTGKVKPIGPEEIRAAFDALAASDRPIVVGPWLSEVGFELLYWIPFLQAAREQGRLDPKRLIVVSRGGTAHWYNGVGGRYRDVFSHFSPEEFRRKNGERIGRQRGGQKQVEIVPFEREIVERVRRELGLGEVDWLHPSLMYNGFRPAWARRETIPPDHPLLSFRPLSPVDGPPPMDLPREFAAVKFYASRAFPDTPENREFVGEVIERLADQIPVVLLDAGSRVDDHFDFPAADGSRIFTIPGPVAPERNLHVQTQIVARARAFVGTYGGFSYLAPLLGVGSVAFFSDAEGFTVTHLELARRVYAGMQAGPFVAMDVKDAQVVQLALGGGAVLQVRGPGGAP